MTLRSIQYLIAIAEYHSFTRAAEVLYVSQPSLSQQIKLLEESLNVQLLDRSGRNVRLTDAGEVYLRHARRALRELDAGKRAIHDLQDLSRGTLRVAMTPITDYLTRPLLEGFNARYPRITVNILEMAQNQIEAALIGDNGDDIDVGIVFTDTFSSEARSNEIEKHLLFVEKLNLAVGDAHPYAGQQAPLSVQALEQESLALLSENFALRRHVDSYFHEHGIAPHIAFETNSVSVIVDIIRHGRLATVLPNTIAREQHGVNAVSLQPELPHHTITLVRRKGAYKSAACRAFAELAAEWCVGGCQMTLRCPLGIFPETAVRDENRKRITKDDKLDAF
jgi:LysR family transcriptional regulator, cyn operon transcriptional activator